MLDTTIRRVRTLQPDVSDAFFDDDVEIVGHRQVLSDLRLAISCWEPPRNQFSAFFLDELTIEKAVRQIVTAVVVKTQKVRCKIVQEAISYDQSEVFDDPLPRNLRELNESEFELDFPLAGLTRRERVLAGESLSVCEACSGGGSIDCDTCWGTGTKACEACDGVGEKTCADCGGAGEVMVSETQTRRCSFCGGSGTQQCHMCEGEGFQTCDAIGCHTGKVDCPTCDANGWMRNQTFLLKETFTKIAHHIYCKNGWVDGSSELATDLAVIRYQSFIGSGEEVKVEMLRSVVPEYLRHDAVRLGLGMAENPTAQAWDLGTRYELRAGYIYHVVVEHLNQPTELFVSGCSSTVTLYKAPEQPMGMGKRLARGVGAFLNRNQVKNAQHVNAMRAGEAFLSDVRLLGPALRRYGLKVSLNPDGYDVILTTAPEGFELVKVNFNYDAAGNVTLHCSVALGDADRDCFPEALLLCNQLPVGQIALQEFNGGALERFFLVNRQPYATTSPPHLAFLLKRLLSTAYQIRKSNRIGLTL